MFNQQQTTTSSDSNIVKFLVPLLKSRYEAGFLRNLYYQFALNMGLCSNNFIHYYFLMSERQYNYLSAKPKEKFKHYRSTTVLYNTIFKIHPLDVFDLKECFDISIKSIQNTSKIHKSSYQKVYMIWLEPRLEIMTNSDSKSLIEYRFLINQLMHKRTSSISATLEKYFDNCGRDLSQMDISKESRSGDLTHEEYFRLFKYLRSREDYPQSTFLQAAAHADENILAIR